ncbi:MAG: carboxypeptidase-like regulatory domain-containing protein [Candidatus Solibacter sp.]
MRRLRSLLAGLAVCAILAASLYAQDPRAHVQGFVVDASNAAIAGAVVTLVNNNTSVKTSRPTNETGLYRFDYVDPGNYNLTVEAPGFSRFSQENFDIRSQADLTVNATLKPGSVQETVTVSGNVAEIEFNTTNNSLTLDTKLTAELPRFDRNPFKLTLLMPSATETRRGEMNPYNSYSANSVELGGNTNLKNNLMVDGSPVGIGYKVAWVPNGDAVQEATVDKNAVDASAGHSAGGTISMSTKSGTNDAHGSVFWLGRNPAFNAVTDRTTGVKAAARNNIYGVAVGNRVIKNKLFNFFSWEVQKPRSPAVQLRSVPTALEKTGDFSQSLTRTGTQLTIYDPYSTTFDPATSAVTRKPFPGNKITPDRFDSLGARWMSEMLSPNRTPDDPTGLNNFSDTVVTITNYYDISDRVDWYLNDKLRIFARPSMYKTNIVQPSPLNEKSPLYVQGGSTRNGFTLAGEAILTLSRGTISFRGDHRSFVDEFHSIKENDTPLQTYWPNNNWFAPYAYPKDVFPTYLPGIVMTGKTTMGRGNANIWSQHPNGSSFSVQALQNRGAHYLKTGFEWRRNGGHLLAVAGNQFVFDPAVTASTFLNPNTALSGNSYATLLLGAISDNSQAVAAPLNQNRSSFFAAYIQDDYKPTRRITLNLGLRWEYETPWNDPLHQQSVGPDFSVPTPGVSTSPPQIPSSVTSLLNQPYSWTGSWVFTSKEHPGIWPSQKLVLMPRVGIAFRVNDLTSLRFGYARYVTPAAFNYTGPPYGSFEAVNLMQPLYAGYDKQQSPLSLNSGVPQAVVSNPFPANNPLVAPGGRDQGAVVGLGTPNIGVGGSDYSRPVNDRFNLQLSRQMPNHVIVEAGLFANFGHNLNYAYNLNQVDPRIAYQYKGATSVNVANPFYNYLTPAQFPGQLRNLQTVPITQLLTQRPQYGTVWEAFKPGAKSQYYSMDFRVQRPFAKGFNVLVGYSYIREKTMVLGSSTNQAPQVNGTGAFFLDPLDNYQNRLTLLDSPNPHHRSSIAGTYQLPFGKGRHFLNNANRGVDAVLGGWQVVSAWYFNSGAYLRYGPALVSGDPAVADPTPDRWFDTNVFKVLPAYTPRTNPDHYPNVRGPIYWEMQSTLSKQVQIIPDRVKFELRGSAYNLTNRLNRADPDVNITSSSFGKALRQLGSVTGRQIELGAKIIF